MSRGPGRWQRAILERLETVPAFYQFEPIPVREGAAQEVEQPRYALCGGPPCNAHPANAGKVRLFYYRRDRPPYRRLVIARPSVDVEALRLCLPRMTRPQSGRIRSRPMG